MIVHAVGFSAGFIYVGLAEMIIEIMGGNPSVH